MYQKRYTKKFKKGLEKFIKSEKISREEIENAVDILANGEKLEIHFRDHALTGEYKGYRECHIHPDILLIYCIRKKVFILVLIDIGTHADLFS
jgi:mRNA interferase YafQ